ncbi:MAG: hypothetical protein WD100_04460, partial [Tistlia sp.]
MTPNRSQNAESQNARPQGARPDTDLIMVCTPDIAGQLRGKAMPRRAIERRREIGVGWTPTNVMLTAFGPIAPRPRG